MRILIDPCSHGLMNLGDAAMFIMAWDRVRQWPGAETFVFTTDAERLAQFAPGAIPVPVAPRRSLYPGRIGWGLRRRMPGYALRVWEQLNGAMTRVSRAGRSARTNSGARLSFASREWTSADLEALVCGCDLLLVSGVGMMNDEFAVSAWHTLAFVELAQALGVPTVMMGQGLGPLSSEIFAAKARVVLPRLDLLALRERRMGPSLARSLGIPADRVVVTGDDALEVSWNLRQTSLGESLGVNVRIADYANMTAGFAAAILDIAAGFAGRRNAPLAPVPISLFEHESDLRSVHTIARSPDEEFRHPRDVARQVSRCRVVLAGSYHAAVFALAQGISVVGIANNPYYDQKMGGLADLFGPACQVIDTRAPDPLARLSTTLERAWDSAEEARSGLLTTAAGLIAAGGAAYEQVFRIADGAHSRRASVA